jgi:hypothetical protein
MDVLYVNMFGLEGNMKEILNNILVNREYKSIHSGVNETGWKKQ